MSDPSPEQLSQSTPYDSPWTVGQRVKMLLWDYVWAIACSWTPKPFNKWRLFWLRLFGCSIEGTPFVHQRARIEIPWNLTLKDRACLGNRAYAYTLGPIVIEEAATVAQESYICTGTHDLQDKAFSLITKPIRIGANAFVGLRAIVLPGVSVGANAVIGAGSIVTKDVPERAIVAGNPAKQIGERP